MSSLLTSAAPASRRAASSATRSVNTEGQKLAAGRIAAAGEPAWDFAQGGQMVAPWRIPVNPSSGIIGASSFFQVNRKILLQRKLEVGSTTDPLEAEADGMAEQVMRGESAAAVASASPSVLRRCACGASGKPCSTCEQKDDEKKKLHRHATGAATPVEAPPIVHQVLRSPGRPLEGPVRRQMEDGFGHDFSRVRVHTGTAADASARAVAAHAYAAGNNIVFANGQYAPSQTAGQRLIAHELAHVVQQAGSAGGGSVVRRSTKVAGCGLLNLAASMTDIGSAAHIQLQAYLASKGISPELGIPRGTKLSPGFGCRSLDTPWGWADLAQRGPGSLNLGEIKPVSFAGRARAKLEVAHYRRRSLQSMQRLFKIPGSCARRTPGPDDQGFALANGLTPATSISYLSGVLAGDVTIGPFSGDPSLILKAKEVGPGAFCYWCTKDASQKSKDPKPRGASVGFGVAIGGSAGGAYNAGVGVSIMSDSIAYGTAGAGISYKSDSKSAGTAGAGASVESDSMAAGAAGAGATQGTQSVGAGVAGAGTSKDSVSAAAGAAASGSSQDSATAGAGVAGKGSVKDSMVASAGSSGSGKVEGVEGAGTGSPGKPVDAKDTQAGGGKAAAQQPAGGDGSAQHQGPAGATAGQAQGAGQGTHAGAGTADKAGDHAGGAGHGAGHDAGTGTGSGDAGAGAGSGSTPTKDPSDTPAGKGAQGALDAGPDHGTGTTPGTDAGTGATGTAGKDGTGTGTGSGSGAPAKVAGGLGVAPIAGAAASEADRQKAAEEAAKVAALLAKATTAQAALFRHLAETAPDGRYNVPSSQWVDTMMQATQGLSEDDIKYLQSLDWKPSNITPDELRKKIEQLLSTKKPPSTGDAAKAGGGDKDAAADKGAQGEGKGAQGEGKGGKDGAGAGVPKGSQPGATGNADKGAKGGAAPSGFVQPHPYTGKLTKFNDTGFQILPDNKQITVKTVKGAKATLEIHWREGSKLKRAKAEYEIIADPVHFTDPDTKRKMLRFDLKSTNTEPLELSAPGSDAPTVLPAGASGSYYVVTSH